MNTFRIAAYAAMAATLAAPPVHADESAARVAEGRLIAGESAGAEAGFRIGELRGAFTITWPAEP